MKESTQKEKVLKNIRDALVNSLEAPFDDVEQDGRVFHPVAADSLDIEFAEAFSRANGRFVFCADMEELNLGLLALVKEKQLEDVYCGEAHFKGLIDQLGIQGTDDSSSLADCQAVITGCEALVARTGSILLSSRQGGGRKSIIESPLHIVIASSRQLLPDISDALRFMDGKYETGRPSMMTFVTGPSRTADIEKKLVHGVHGPREVYLFLVDVSG